jgi:hypothetical protein
MEEYFGGWEKQHLKGFSQMYTLFLLAILVNFVDWCSKSIFMPIEKGVMNETARVQQSA